MDKVRKRVGVSERSFSRQVFGAFAFFQVRFFGAFCAHNNRNREENTRSAVAQQRWLKLWTGVLDRSEGHTDGSVCKEWQRQDTLVWLTRGERGRMAEAHGTVRERGTRAKVRHGACVSLCVCFCSHKAEQGRHRKQGNREDARLEMECTRKDELRRLKEEWTKELKSLAKSRCTLRNSAVSESCCVRCVYWQCAKTKSDTIRLSKALLPHYPIFGVFICICAIMHWQNPK